MTHEDYLKGVNTTWLHADKHSELTHCRLAIMEEIGEIVGWYKKIHGYKRQKDDKWRTEMKGELGDLLYYLVKLFDIIDETEMIEYDFEMEIEESRKLNEVTHTAEMMRMAVQLTEFSSDSNLFINSLEGIFDYLRLLIHHEGFDFEDVALSNLSKLKARHGNSFNNKSTTEEGRDRENESNALNDVK